MHGNTKHGYAGTHFYGVWFQMVRRCTNPDCRSYKYYGGRGITVCDRWLDFNGFREDMFEGYRRGLVIDRIDNNKGYSKDNCRWTTVRENNRNKRNNHYIDTPKGKMLLCDAEVEYGVDHRLICSRMKRGRTGADLVSKESLTRVDPRLHKVEFRGKLRTFKEIAEITGESLNAIRGRWYRGRRGNELTEKRIDHKAIPYRYNGTDYPSINAAAVANGVSEYIVKKYGEKA